MSGVVDKISDGVQSIGHAVEHAADDVKHFAEDTGDKIKNVAVDAGDKIKNIAVDAYNDTKHVAEEGYNKVKDGVSTVAKAGEDIVFGPGNAPQKQTVDYSSLFASEMLNQNNSENDGFYVAPIKNLKV